MFVIDPGLISKRFRRFLLRRLCMCFENQLSDPKINCPLPCQNGICLDLRHEESRDYTNGYYCHCEPGWSGLYCHIPVSTTEVEAILHKCLTNDEIEIPESAICDNIVDCPNGEDENGSMAECNVEKTRGFLGDGFTDR